MIAVITGVTSQDGSYLAELLLAKHYRVYGITRDIEAAKTNPKLQHVLTHSQFCLMKSDLTNRSSVAEWVTKTMPDEIYHLAAISNIAESFEHPEESILFNGISCLNCLAVIHRLRPRCKFYFAGTAELYGKQRNEIMNPLPNTCMNPQSPYALGKIIGYEAVKFYRQCYNLFAVTGILFNHESPRRGEAFVTRKISKGVASIVAGKQEFIELGNLDSVKDWGSAQEYVEAMWMMLQQPTPSDFVCRTGKTYTVRQFVEEAFRCVGKTIFWIKHDNPMDEVGVDEYGSIRVRISPQLFRHSDKDAVESSVQPLMSWAPHVSFQQIVDEMVKADLNSVK